MDDDEIFSQENAQHDGGTNPNIKNHESFAKGMAEQNNVEPFSDKCSH